MPVRKQNIVALPARRSCFHMGDDPRRVKALELPGGCLSKVAITGRVLLSGK
jgi:hypothetical protein